ncbi:MAG: ABC transporter permease subunit, partial [Euzebyales bacterium]|nr:ABC transporter permease subunit [Euzebyales bacterium]
MPQTPPTAAAVRQQRPPPWRDVRVLRVVLQVVFAIAVVALLWFLASNLLTNLRSAGLPTGFDYLGRPHGTDIRDSDFRPSQAVRAAIIVALVNTVRVASVGILLASVLGLLIGLARLSTNWLVRRAAAAYVELLRNVPVLVIIIFMYVAVILRLPPISRPIEAVGAFVFSNRGLAVPWGESEDGAGGFTLVLLVALVVALAVAWWRTRRNERTGEPHHRFLWGLGVFAGVAALGYIVLGGPVTLTVPTRDGRVVAGGINLGPEYAAVLIGLVIYTASHIAEITRGSILAVPKGQSEAANAVALSGFQRLRYVVLPQALRIAVPPVANQYLNLTKNSS